MATGGQAVTVWFDTHRTHYYVFPDELELPPGGLFLRSSRGGHRTVDPEAAAAYEIPKDDAVRQMRDELEEAVDRVKGSVQGLFNLGQDKAERGQDADQLFRQLGKVFGSAVGAIQETLTNPAAADQTRANVEKLKEDLAVEAERVEPAMTAFGERLRDIFTAPEITGAIENLGKGLQEMAAAMQRTREAHPRSEPGSASSAHAWGQQPATPPRTTGGEGTLAPDGPGRADVSSPERSAPDENASAGLEGREDQPTQETPVRAPDGQG